MLIPASAAPRPASTFLSEIIDLPPGEARDTAIWKELEAGNVPAFLRTPARLILSPCASVEVLVDYLSIGVDDDFVRVPMTPLLAQRVCDAWDAQLPTKHVVDLIWQQATNRLAPAPWGPPYDASMLSVSRFAAHDLRIKRALERESALGARGCGLIAGHKKDVVVTPELAYFTHHVAIYGWHQSNGIPIQSLNPRRGGAANTHEDTYADYSHGIRLLSRGVVLNGDSVLFSDLLAGDEHALVSDEGPSLIWRY